MADKYDTEGVPPEQANAARERDIRLHAEAEARDTEKWKKLSEEIDRKMPLSRVLKELRREEEMNKKPMPTKKKLAAGGVVRGAGRAIRGVRPARFV